MNPLESDKTACLLLLFKSLQLANISFFQCELLYFTVTLAPQLLLIALAFLLLKMLLAYIFREFTS